MIPLCIDLRYHLPKRVCRLKYSRPTLLAMNFFLLFLLASCTQYVSEDKCTNDIDCNGDEICIGGRCLQPADECLADADCPSGNICFSRRCQESFCNTDCDCMVDSVCLKGHCDISINQCYSQQDCPEGASCDYAFPELCLSKRCIENECSQDSTCTMDEICLNGRCDYPECYYALDCDDDRYCRSYRCQQAQCDQTSDCSASGLVGYICYRATCEAYPCSTKYDCPYGFACDLEWRLCRDLKDRTCETNGGCPYDSLCSGGRCLRPECEFDDDCLPVETCNEGLCKFVSL